MTLFLRVQNLLSLLFSVLSVCLPPPSVQVPKTYLPRKLLFLSGPSSKSSLPFSPSFSSFGGCTAHCCSHRRPSRPARLCCIWLAGLELSRRGGRGKTRRPTYQVFLLLREFHATRQRTKRSNSSQLWICRRELVPCR